VLNKYCLLLVLFYILYFYFAPDLDHYSVPAATFQDIPVINAPMTSGAIQEARQLYSSPMFSTKPSTSMIRPVTFNI